MHCTIKMIMQYKCYKWNIAGNSDCFLYYILPVTLFSTTNVLHFGFTLVTIFLWNDKRKIGGKKANLDFWVSHWLLQPNFCRSILQKQCKCHLQKNMQIIADCLTSSRAFQRLVSLCSLNGSRLYRRVPVNKTGSWKEQQIKQ